MPRTRSIWIALMGALVLGGCPRPAPPAQEPAAVVTPAEPVPEPVAEPKPEPAPEPEPEPALVLDAVGFAEVPGWREDQLGESMGALQRSCEKLTSWPDDRKVGKTGVGGTAADWKPACRAAGRVPAGDHQAARAFFEQHFRAYLATDNGEPGAHFTGYYEAHIPASRKRRGPYRWPVYRRPPELVMVYLDRWYENPRPRRVAGRVVGGQLRPYYTRAEIMDGALAGRGLELFWARSPADVFFAQVQGSGIVELPDGKQVRIGYAAQNGHPYTAIGRVLIERGEVSREDMSMQAIRAWLDANPARADALLRENQAFVFFDIEKRAGAIGAHGLVLTPERSLAVDPYFMPLLAPVFVVTDVPDPDRAGETMPFRKLMLAQDTGGAIRGPTRGDLFFGAGERAFTIAGQLKGRGQYYLLLPRTVSVAPPAAVAVLTRR